MAIPASVDDGARRRDYRAAFVVEVNGNSHHTFWTGFTRNISRGGLFLASRTMLPLGARLELELRLPDGGPTARVTGEVKWYREETAMAGEHGGMGLQFVDLDPAFEARINAFVDRVRDAMFFDVDD